MKNAPILHRIEYGIVRTVRGTLRALPHARARALGRPLGELLWWVSSKRRGIARANLERALPDLPPAEIPRLARASFHHLGAATCDALSASRFDLVSLCQRVRYEGWEHLENAKARGKGYIVLSAHLGCWEIAALIAGAYFGPLHVVGRPLDNPHLDRDLEALRARFGNKSIPKRGAARGMVRALLDKGVVGILIDQRVKPHEGIRVPFFGQPATTSPLLARLALRFQVPVVPIFAFPEPDGRYLFLARPPIEPQGRDDSEEDIAAMTRTYLEACEKEIRHRPEQWMWLHERWKG